MSGRRECVRPQCAITVGNAGFELVGHGSTNVEFPQFIDENYKTHLANTHRNVEPKLGTFDERVMGTFPTERVSTMSAMVLANQKSKSDFALKTGVGVFPLGWVSSFEIEGFDSIERKDTFQKALRFVRIIIQAILFDDDKALRPSRLFTNDVRHFQEVAPFDCHNIRKVKPCRVSRLHWRTGFILRDRNNAATICSIARGNGQVRYSYAAYTRHCFLPYRHVGLLVDACALATTHGN